MTSSATSAADSTDLPSALSAELTSLPLRHPRQLLDIWFWHDAINWLGAKGQAHFKRLWWAWVLAVLCLWGFSHYYWVGINITKSLPQRFFFIKKTDLSVARDDIISFRWDGGPPYPKGITFTKIAKGVPGDVVTVQGRDFYINGQFVASAKPYSKMGEPLALGPTGVIPPDHYFVWTPHIDSLDSRYALTGWIKAEQLQGKSIPLF